jgi:competence protein ComEC
MERQLVCSGDRVGPADLLIVSHHGSSLSSSPALLSVLKPRVAIVENGPKKGGDKVVLERLGQLVPKPAVWQLHAATRSPEADQPAEFIANSSAEGDQAFGISAEVSADGAIRVVNERTGRGQTYARSK